MNPDFHGVSANYISQKTKLLSSLDDLQLTNFCVDKDLLTEGMSVSYQMAKEAGVGPFPAAWNIESNLSSYLYAYVMAKKPKFVVETGVANGLSTRILMKALEQTGGELHSFDIRNESCSVYQGTGKWTFHLVPTKNQKKFFSDLVANWEIDLWFHDGDHSFMWQEFEYKLAFSKLASGGLLLSDDVDTSEAWIEFCEKIDLEHTCVFDSRKIFGIATRKEKI